MGRTSGPEATVTDRRTLYVTAFIRALATSLFGVLSGVYLAKLGLSPEHVGGVIAAGLAGACAAALLATFAADRVGRRRFLLGLALLSASGTVAFAFGHGALLLGVAAFIGMLNGMGRDRGAALVLEQAALPSTTTDAQRTQTIAFYTMLQDLGHAAGALLAGVPSLLTLRSGMTGLHADRAVLLGCAALGLAGFALYTRLGPDVERGAGSGWPRLSPASQRILTRICALFALDGLGGGFLTTAMLSYFFFERFGVGEAAVGAIFFGARLMNAISHVGAAWLAKRIGLVNTMVFTHIPSSLLLVTVAYAPSLTVAVLLFLLREGLVEMDVPTRQSYVLAVVAPEERTLASGVTNLVRLAAWSAAPALAAAVTGSLLAPLLVGAGMKILYDVLLYFAFRGVRPPEEAVTSSRAA